MARDVVERRRRPGEVAVEELRASHRQPGVVQERVELLARAESLLLWRVVLFLGLLLDAVELDRLLHLLDGALEVARRLWQLLVGACLGGMRQHGPGVVVLIVQLHLLELFLVMLFAVVVDVVAGGEGLPVARQGRVLLRGARAQQGDCRHGEHSRRAAAPPQKLTEKPGRLSHIPLKRRASSLYCPQTSEQTRKCRVC